MRRPRLQMPARRGADDEHTTARQEAARRSGSLRFAAPIVRLACCRGDSLKDVECDGMQGLLRVMRPLRRAYVIGSLRRSTRPRRVEFRREMKGNCENMESLKEIRGDSPRGGNRVRFYPGTAPRSFAATKPVRVAFRSRHVGLPRQRESGVVSRWWPETSSRSSVQNTRGQRDTAEGLAGAVTHNEAPIKARVSQPQPRSGPPTPDALRMISGVVADCESTSHARSWRRPGSRPSTDVFIPSRGAHVLAWEERGVERKPYAQVDTKAEAPRTSMVWGGRRAASSRAVATGACVRASSDESVSEVCEARTIARGNTLVVAPPSASPQLPSNWVCLQAFIDARIRKTSHHQDATIAVWSTILKLTHRWQFTKSRPSSRANPRARVPVQTSVYAIPRGSKIETPRWRERRLCLRTVHRCSLSQGLTRRWIRGWYACASPLISWMLSKRPKHRNSWRSSLFEVRSDASTADTKQRGFEEEMREAGRRIWWKDEKARPKQQEGSAESPKLDRVKTESLDSYFHSAIGLSGSELSSPLLTAHAHYSYPCLLSPP
ncbi:hypothetical protein B0H14DRAFT_3728468 [Mycena olivaceomarginata]|nr:hypothetical protein B0H14DRAFT_3728468 [Mycena olivaceomarginata]